MSRTFSLLLVLLLVISLLSFSRAEEEVDDFDYDGFEEDDIAGVEGGAVEEEATAPELAITKSMFCDACHVTVEYAWRNVITMEKDGFDMDHTTPEFGMAVCGSNPINKFNKRYQVVCHNLFRDHQADLVAPFAEEDFQGLQAKKPVIRKHMAAFCHENGHCASPKFITPTPKSRDDCAICNELTGDLNLRLSRYESVEDITLREVEHDLCRLVQLRHGKIAGEVEDLCWELTADYTKQFQAVLTHKQAHPDMNLLRPICTDILDLCPAFEPNAIPAEYLRVHREL